MNLDQFIYQLHFAIDQVQPPDWKVNWDKAPLPYKLYKDLPSISLPLDIPLTLDKKKWKPTLEHLGYFLWYGYGLTQCSEYIDADFHMQIRRYVPSGGALYPNEIYLYLRLEGLPKGIYHYNVAHHSLTVLREGDFDDYLMQALGSRCDLSSCFALLFVSTYYWKNFFKYHLFSYRLQGLDTGVLMGQLLEVAKSFGFEAGVYYQFLDRAIHHLLGITEQEESVYALIPLSTFPLSKWFYRSKSGEVGYTAQQLCKEIEKIQHEHNYCINARQASALFFKVNEASMLESTQAFKVVQSQKKEEEKKKSIFLPTASPLTYDLAEVCRRRFSPGMDFIMQPLSLEQVATLCRKTLDSYYYASDLDEGKKQFSPRVSLAGCMVNIQGIKDGAYIYDDSAHALQIARLGDHRERLQQGLTFQNIPLTRVPLCFHVLGDPDHLKRILGYRGYRIQQMEVGMLTQRLLIVATALEMGGHPLLGYEESDCNQLYCFKQDEKTCLIQIPVGFYRLGARLTGRLHC